MYSLQPSFLKLQLIQTLTQPLLRLLLMKKPMKQELLPRKLPQMQPPLKHSAGRNLIAVTIALVYQESATACLALMWNVQKLKDTLKVLTQTNFAQSAIRLNLVPSPAPDFHVDTYSIQTASFSS